MDTFEEMVVLFWVLEKDYYYTTLSIECSESIILREAPKVDPRNEQNLSTTQP
jgi:hypothetical protein